MNTFLGLLVGTLGFHQAPFAALDASRRPVIRSHRTAAPVRAISWPLSAPTTDDAAGPLKVLYDSKCMVCLTNKALLSFFDRRHDKIDFVDIRDDNYSPSKNGGVKYADAMRHFHVVAGDGTVSEGSEAVLNAYSKVGLGWVMAVLRFPLIRWLIDGIYAFVSKHRYTISKVLPGGKALAAAVDSLHDVESAALGYGCEDEEECMLDYDDE